MANKLLPPRNYPIPECACCDAKDERIRELEACVLEYWHAKDWGAVGAADSTAAKLLPAEMKARATNRITQSDANVEGKK